MNDSEIELLVRLKYHIITKNEYERLAYSEVKLFYPATAWTIIDHRWRNSQKETIDLNYKTFINILIEELYKYDQKQNG